LQPHRPAGKSPLRLRLVEPIALRPLAFGEVLDTAFNLFKRNFKTVLLISVVIMVPLVLISGAAAAGLAPGEFTVADAETASPEEVLGFLVPLLGAAGFGALVQMLGSLLVQAATTRVYSEAYRGIRLDPRTALRVGLARLPAMLGLTLLSSLAFLVGILLCVLPGVWLYVALGLAPAALIAEGSGVFASLGRSFRLVQGSWWRVCGLLLVAGLIVAVITSVVTAPLQLGATFGAGLAGPDTLFSGGYLALNVIVSGLVSAVTLPFTAAVVVAVYYDQRVRKEAYDLERLIADLGDPPGAPMPPSPTDPSDPFGLG